jgi:hypothetical protein
MVVVSDGDWSGSVDATGERPDGAIANVGQVIAMWRHIINLTKIVAP